MVKVATVFAICWLGIIGSSGLIEASRPDFIDLLMLPQRLRELRPVGVELANVSIAKIEDKAWGLKEVACFADLTRWLEALKNKDFWALKMVDAWGSKPSGLYYGNFYSLGNFDECLSISTQFNSSYIRGKYCLLSVSLGEILGIAALKTRPVNIGTCFPASCSAAQAEEYLEQALHSFSFNISSSLSISESTCQTNESKAWDGLTIFTVVVLSAMAILVALFTIYDYFVGSQAAESSALVKAFSARANSRALFRIVERNSNPKVIDCLHGIRCLSIIWVVFSHVYLYFMPMPNINLFQVISWAETPFANVVLHGVFSVDSFFFLGGLLVSLIALSLMVHTKGKLNVPLMYLHRLIRILPVLAVAILVYMKLMPLVSGGPLFYNGYHGKEACEKGWYWTLLFIQNYATTDILYLISPFLLLALWKWGWKAVTGIGVLIVLLSGCLLATMMVNHFSFLIKNTSGNDLASHKLYQATHRHAAPWLIGFLFGYFLHVNRGKKFRLNALAVITGWLLSLSMLAASLFALYPASRWSAPALSTVEESLYYTLSRLAWPLALCWIVFACMQGYGGLANSFLSSPLWQPLSRLSYSVYIWHMFVVEVTSKSVRTSVYFSDYSAMLKFWSDFGFTVILSYVFYLIIEAPLGGFDSLFRLRKKTTPQQE